MDAATLLALLRTNRLHAVVFEKEIWDAGVAKARREADVPNDPGTLHVKGNVGLLSLEELNDAL